MKMTSNIFWKQLVSIRNTMIKKHPHWVSILKRAVLNQTFSPPAIQTDFSRRNLPFVMSQIQENNFVVQSSL